MKKILLSIFAIAALFSCNNTTETTDETLTDSTAVEIAEVPVILLGELNTKAGEYVGKEVQVTGIVDHICKHSGKKILLVSDDGEIHVEAEERFDENIAGHSITLNGIINEFRVDEAYCLKMEEETINSHEDGDENDEDIEAKNKRKAEEIKYYRDSMITAGINHISYYSIDYVSHIVNE